MSPYASAFRAKDWGVIRPSNCDFWVPWLLPCFLVKHGKSHGVIASLFFRCRVATWNLLEWTINLLGWFSCPPDMPVRGVTSLGGMSQPLTTTAERTHMSLRIQLSKRLLFQDICFNMNDSELILWNDSMKWFWNEMSFRFGIRVEPNRA